MSLDLSNNPPLIIAGDFNDWNQKSSQVFEEELGMQEAFKSVHGRFAKTFPAGFPMLCLDRIYIRNLEVIKSHIIERPEHQNHFSDHLPIFCELALKEPVI